MSLRERGQIGGMGIVGGGQATGPMFDQSGGAFRGEYLHLVENGTVKDGDYIGSNYANGEFVRGCVVPSKADSGVRRASVEVGGGLYGDDCLAIEYDHLAVSFDSANNRVLSIAHGFSDDDIVGLSVYDTTQDALPAELKMSSPPGGIQYYVFNANADDFQLSLTDSGNSPAAVVFSDNGTNPSTGSFGAFSVTGAPGCWIGTFVSNNPNPGGFTNAGVNKFLANINGRPYNRFEVYFKFDAGYRVQWAQKLNNGQPEYPFYQMMHCGTYHASDLVNDEEEAGYHFYWWLWFMMHRTDAQWLRVKLAERPPYQRSTGAGHERVHNPVPVLSEDGGFWDTETRFYFDHIDYYQSPQIFGRNLKMLIDRLRVYYEDPPYSITMNWDQDSVKPANPVDPAASPPPSYLSDGSSYQFDFKITNHEQTSISGVLVQCYRAESNAAIYTSAGVPASAITIPAGGTWSGYVELSPEVGAAHYSYAAGVTFAPDDQFNDDGDSTTNQPSFSNLNVDRRDRVAAGTHDSWNWSVTHNYNVVSS